jgi:hypothetical protein
MKQRKPRVNFSKNPRVGASSTRRIAQRKGYRIKHYLDKSVIPGRNQLLVISYAQEYLWIRSVFRIYTDNIAVVRFKHAHICFHLTIKYALTASNTTVTLL